MDIEAQFTLNQSRADEITMKEDDGGLMRHEDGFDLSFGDIMPSGTGIIQHTSGFDTAGPSLKPRGSGFDESDSDFLRHDAQYEQSAHVSY